MKRRIEFKILKQLWTTEWMHLVLINIQETLTICYFYSCLAIKTFILKKIIPPLNLELCNQYFRCQILQLVELWALLMSQVWWCPTASLISQSVKNPPAVQETPVQFLGWEDPLEKEMATHSSILAWRIPWTEEPVRLQSMRLHELDTTSDWTTNCCCC